MYSRRRHKSNLLNKQCFPINIKRFGRGIGLQFIKLKGEWRPGREGRQEIIKVKIFEDQNVGFRANVAGRVRRDGTALTQQIGNVIVATITPDKLVRFWTSHGGALGSLDQVIVDTCGTRTAIHRGTTFRSFSLTDRAGCPTQKPPNIIIAFACHRTMCSVSCNVDHS